MTQPPDQPSGPSEPPQQPEEPESRSAPSEQPQQSDAGGDDEQTRIGQPGYWPPANQGQWPQPGATPPQQPADQGGWQQPQQPDPGGWQQPAQPEPWQQPEQGGWQQPPQGPSQQPGDTGQPGYWQQPEPGWQQQPNQGWQQPQQGPSQPNQGWQQPQPGWQQPPDQAWQQPPGWQPPGQQPPGQWEHLGPPMAGPPGKRRRRAPIIAAVVATVAVVGGGTATYLAVSDTQSGYKGAASPQGAVSSLVADLNKSDILGILDHLAPGERTSLLDPVKEAFDQEKRLHVLKSSADLSHFEGVDVTAANVTYDKTDLTVNDHVKIVKLTGGTITINADLSKVPYTDEFLKAIAPNGLPSPSTAHHTVNLADLAKESGKPVEIAAQKVDGKWYPSLMYTIAQAAIENSGTHAPGPDDYVAPNGAATPQDAVKQAVDAVSKADYRRLIELASPEELAVLHDYGGLILNNAGESTPEFAVKDLQLNSKDISGGKRITLRSITVDTAGHETTVKVNGDCLEVTADGDFQKFCTSRLIDLLNSGPLHDKPLTDEQKGALTRLAEGVPNIGIDVSSTGGKWYINPLRSYLDISNALVEPLHDNDLIVILKLFTTR